MTREADVTSARGLVLQYTNEQDSIKRTNVKEKQARTTPKTWSDMQSLDKRTPGCLFI